MIDARTLADIRAEIAIQAALARIKGILAGTMKEETMKDSCPPCPPMSCQRSGHFDHSGQREDCHVPRVPLMSPNCTQNNGDCLTCSLNNYGRDCRNQPITRPADAEADLDGKDNQDT